MASKKTAKKKTARKAPRATARSKGLSLNGVSPSFTAGDLQKSIAWYQDVLGFVVKDRWESDGKLMGVEIWAGTTVFMLAQDDWKKGRDRVKGEGFRLYCETSQDVDRLADQIQARGGTLSQPPHDEPWGARLFSVEDPDGFKITIAKPKRATK
jgi:uncharacterized glyoxalase superfamily protein PhnB